MKRTKYFNQVKVKNLKKAPENAGVEIRLFFEPYSDCVKLGVGTMYDDHCAFDWLLSQVEYDPSLFSSKPTSIEVLSDIDKIYLTKENPVIEVIYQPHQAGEKFIADKNFIEKLFVIKKQIWSDNGFVGWVSCIPEFSPYEETKLGEIRTEFLNKLWNIPDNFEWYEEGHAESGVEPTDSLELGHLKNKFYFIDENKMKKELNEKYEYILKADKYEDWMWLLQIEARADKRYDVVKKIYKLKYETDKEFYNKAVKKRIEELKNIRLYEVGFATLPFDFFGYKGFVKFTPFAKEWEEAEKEYKKIYNDLIIVESRAGFFIANKKDKVWNVKVPNEKKGLFIGKKGANIKALANEYKVRINLI